MSATSKIDPSTLGWVKNEIDETLKQARLALESYTENPSDDTRLRFCVTHLHQVVGTLEMVELDGAAMLARDAESLARGILDERIKADGKTFDILTRAILTLPDYLARLQFGQMDNPIGLVPVINELRTLSGAKLMDEADLFEPDLSVRPANKNDIPKADEDTYRKLAKQIRHPFQMALLKWLRDTNDKGSLNEIADILSQLGNSNIGIIEQLFWVADGFVEALLSGDLKATNERKKLFSRLDQQIRKLVEGSDRTSLRNSSESLVKKILFEIGRSRSEGPKVTQLKRAFELEKLLSGVSDDAALAAMPTPEALQSVSVALGKEIEAAQDLLSAFFDPEQEDVTSLDPLLELLHKMSSTIDMLGVPMLKELVDELVAVGKAVVDNKIQNQDTVAMAMARALLLIENSAKEIHKSAASWKRQLEEIVQSLQTLREGSAEDSLELSGFEVRDTELSETEYNQLLGVVGDEIRINLNKIEEALESFAADARQVGYLDEVPANLNQIQGALEILGQPRAAELTDLTLQCVDEIRNKEITADAEVLDGLAVAVGTIGAYVEGLQYSRPNLDIIIDRAVDELRTATSEKHKIAGDPTVLISEIEKQLSSWLSNTDDTSAVSAMSQHLDAISALARSQNQEKIERISGEMNKLLHIIHDDPGQLSDDIINTLKQSFDTLALLSKQYLATTTVVPVVEDFEFPSAPDNDEYLVDDYEEELGEIIEAIPGPEPVMAEPVVEFEDDEDIDEEIVQIFIEDARDVMKTVDKETTNWIQQPDNHDTLLELRRGYHTLKGSGRMVGASVISELAWAVESMLNKVRDQKIAHSPAMLELLQEVRAIFPALIDKFERGEVPTEDTESLRQRAEELTSSSPAFEIAPTAAEPAGQVESVDETPRLDPTLLQIFTTEARGHVETMKAEVRDCVENRSSCLVTANLLRATHTLRGSARSLGLMPMSDACGEMEKLLQEIQARNMPLSEDHIKMLTEIENSVSDLMVTLGQGQGLPENHDDRFARIQSMIHNEFQRLEDEKHIAPSPPVTDSSILPHVVAEPLVSPEPMITPATSQLGDGVDPELLEIFLEEAVDILVTVDHSLRSWRRNPTGGDDVHELKRALHTLKGGARMAGLITTGDLSHNTESALKGVEEGTTTVSKELFDLLDEVHDTLVSMIDQIKNNEPLADIQDLNARVISLFSDDVPIIAIDVDEDIVLSQSGLPPVSGLEPQPAIPGFTDPAPAFNEQAVPTQTGQQPPAPLQQAPAHDVPLFAKHTPVPANETAEQKQQAQKKERGGVTRVRTGLLDDLVNFAGEVSISRSRMEQQIYGFRENLGELHQNVNRFRDQLRELEIQSESQILYRSGDDVSDHSSDFDPLEFDRFSRLQQLSRGLTESLHDLGTIQTNLDNFVGDAETVLQQQARINTELQEGLMRTRMVSFSTQSARLRHIVRQTARELGKRAELKLIGSDVEVDRNVLERMIAPFEHMIRNAIDHGIESETERRLAGKNTSGTISISTKQQGSEIVISFSDDGMGLNVDAIRHKAVERGLIGEGERLSNDAIIQFILVSGFSTASSVTHLSGRGVGMDVVHNEVKRLGGSMSVDTQHGVGTTFIIRLPLTLSVTQALLVYAGEQIFAIPLSSVDNILEVDREQVSSLSMGTKPMFNHNDQVYPYVNLAGRLGQVAHPRAERKAPVLLVRTGTREFAMQVDGLAGTREVVIKALNPMLSELAGFAGATILGDGTVILILDIGGLLLSEEGMQVAHTPVVARPVEKPKRERALIMVVDDSLTVRKVTGKHLQKRGYEVITAKDGLDAVEQLRETIPDIMLIDIEMPRMDGYELTKRVRFDAELQHIPIIMITSRAGEKHRKRAFDLGANDYMSKPYQEEALFANIDRLLKESN